MTWSEDVALIFLQFLRDPEIIRYLLDIAKPIHLNFISEEARDFHVSLRMTREKRWALTKELCKLRKFNQMNKIVPITCSLPFDDGMWTRSCKLLRMIRYFRPSFIQGKYEIYDNHYEDRDLELSLKIRAVNLIFEDSFRGDSFKNLYCLGEIQEALSDLEIYEDWNINTNENEYIENNPYLLIDKNNQCFHIHDIVN